MREHRPNALTFACVCAAGLVGGCVSAGESAAYYPDARQSDPVSAASRSFAHINLPLEEVSESVVRSKKVHATEVWSPEEMRARLSCDKPLSQIDPESVWLTMQARVIEDPKKIVTERHTPGADTRVVDTTLHLQLHGKALANGKSTDCSIAPQFAQQVIDDIGALAGVPARRTPGRPVPGKPIISIGGGE